MAGLILEQGYAGEQDIETAIYWYKKAMENDDNEEKVKAQWRLGLLYRDYYPNENFIGLLEEAANNDNLSAKIHLSHAYYFGKGVKQDKIKAKVLAESTLQTIEPREEDSYVTDTEMSILFTILGKFYNEIESFDQARYFLSQAVKLGNNPNAKYTLAMLYKEGKGIKKNLKKATQLFIESADAGILSSNWHLYEIYVEQMKYHEAMEILKDMSNQNEAHASAILGLIHFHSDERYGILRPDYGKSFYYFKRAAELDEDDSMLMLGLHYYNGWGVNIDKQAGAKIVEKAAELGNAEAQFKTGLRYYYGMFFPFNDKSKGMSWLQRAAHAGHKEAIEAIKNIECHEEQTYDYVEKVLGVAKNIAFSELLKLLK
jgi:TPR repeat protein